MIWNIILGDLTNTSHFLKKATFRQQLFYEQSRKFMTANQSCFYWQDHFLQLLSSNFWLTNKKITLIHFTGKLLWETLLFWAHCHLVGKKHIPKKVRNITWIISPNPHNGKIQELLWVNCHCIKITSMLPKYRAARAGPCPTVGNRVQHPRVKSITLITVPIAPNGMTPAYPSHSNPTYPNGSIIKAQANNAYSNSKGKRRQFW